MVFSKTGEWQRWNATGKHRYKARALQLRPACKHGQLTLQMSSCCPLAKTGCCEKTDWDRSVGTYKTPLRHLEIYQVNELHQDMGLSYWSPFKRLNWCCVNKRTVKEKAEILFPFHLFPLLLFLSPLPPFWALVPSPKFLKRHSSKDCWREIDVRINFLLIPDCLFQRGGRKKGEG